MRIWVLSLVACFTFTFLNVPVCAVRPCVPGDDDEDDDHDDISA